jgi:hypothetical protein
MTKKKSTGEGLSPEDSMILAGDETREVKR